MRRSPEALLRLRRSHLGPGWGHVTGGQPTLAVDPLVGSASHGWSVGAAVAPASPQLGQTVETLLPFWTKEPSEETLHLRCERRAPPAGRYRDGQITAAQHGGRMEIGENRGVLHMDQRTARAGGLGERRANGGRRVGDENEMRRGEFLRGRETADEPRGRRLGECRRWCIGVESEALRPGFSEKPKPAQRAIAVSDEDDPKTPQINHQRQHRPASSR